MDTSGTGRSEQTSQSNSSGNKLYKLEALRGLAAAYVVFHHATPQVWYVSGINVGILFRFGQEAVILFFLLSGFVIHYSYTIGRNKSFGDYFTKRALRIYVPLLIVLPLSYLVASYQASALLNPDWRTLAGNIAMLQDWGWAKPNVLMEVYMDNGPLWSLSYEWWFYMLYWPVCHYIASVRARDTVVLGTAVACALVYLAWPTFVPRLLMYMGIWWCGVMLAEAFMRGQIGRVRTYWPLLASMLVIVLILGFGALLERSAGTQLLFGKHPVLELRHFLFTVIALGGAWTWHRFHWIAFDLLLRPFLWIAPISYGIYITHAFLLADATYLDFLPNPAVELIGYLATTVLVSWVIERRIYPGVRRRVTAHLRRRRTSSAIA